MVTERAAPFTPDRAADRGASSLDVASLKRRAATLRRQAGRLLVERFYLRVASLGRRVPLADPARLGLEVLRDVPYLPSGLREHTLDVYRPADAKDLPVVLYLHGGGFHSLSKDTHWIMGMAFARRGLVVAMPNYRLAPQHRFPAHLEDASEALRYVHQHAREWGGDPSRIIFAGESAGANLAASLTLAIAYERDEPYARVALATGVYPQAVLAACGVFEVSNAKRFAEKYQNMSWFFDDRYIELEELYAQHVDGVPQPHDLMNPLHLVEREAPKRALPPFFLPVGSRDHLKDDHARFARALQARGVDVEAPVYDGEIHAFHAFIFRKNAQKCWDDHFRFLHARGLPVDLEPKRKVGFGIR
jgi:acetyl esterase